MRKIALGCLVLLLITTLCFAQGSRSPQVATYTGREDAVTYFTNIGVTGYDANGNPGYIAFTGTENQQNVPITWYLWVDDTGDLCLASYSNVTNYSSFPTGDWSTTNSYFPCTKVGGQS